MAAAVLGSLVDPTTASNRKQMASSQTFSIEQGKPSPGISLKTSTVHWPGLCHMFLPTPMIDGPRLPKLRPEASQIAKTNLGVFLNSKGTPEILDICWTHELPAQGIYIVNVGSHCIPSTML